LAIQTYREQLEEVQACISKILRLGQSHSAEGRSMTRADLPTLYDAEARLRALADREAGGGITVRAGTPVDA
jgi:hypothetical protein